MFLKTRSEPRILTVAAPKSSEFLHPQLSLA
jgi:hypothetical protein